MGLSTTYTKAEVDLLLQKQNAKIVGAYQGDLNISDTAPTTKGIYALLEVGTYTNLGGLVTTANKLNFASFDGTTWSLIAVDIDVEEKIPDDFFVFEQQKTGEKLWIYNHSSFRGWFSKQNRNVSSIKKIRLYKSSWLKILIQG